MAKLHLCIRGIYHSFHYCMNKSLLTHNFWLMRFLKKSSWYFFLFFLCGFNYVLVNFTMKLIQNHPAVQFLGRNQIVSFPFGTKMWCIMVVLGKVIYIRLATCTTTYLNYYSSFKKEFCRKLCFIRKHNVSSDVIKANLIHITLV